MKWNKLIIHSAVGVMDSIVTVSASLKITMEQSWHDDVIKWKHFSHYWPSPATGVSNEWINWTGRICRVVIVTELIVFY